VTINGVWIDNLIYWPLTTRNYKYNNRSRILQFTVTCAKASQSNVSSPVFDGRCSSSFGFSNCPRASASAKVSCWSLRISEHCEAEWCQWLIHTWNACFLRTLQHVPAKQIVCACSNVRAVNTIIPRSCSCWFADYRLLPFYLPANIFPFHWIHSTFDNIMTKRN
jgi:hypothetical protein